MGKDSEAPGDVEGEELLFVELGLFLAVDSDEFGELGVKELGDESVFDGVARDVFESTAVGFSGKIGGLVLVEGCLGFDGI